MYRCSIINHPAFLGYLDDELEKAEHFFNLALHTAKKQKRKFSVAENNLGLIQLRLRHFDKALKLFKSAEKSGMVTPTFNKLQLYLQFGQLSKAKELAFTGRYQR